MFQLSGFYSKQLLRSMSLQVGTLKGSEFWAPSFVGGLSGC